MKKIIYWLFMLPLFALLNGCDDTDTIIFDDELPQFEIKANAILLEVIMPKGSAADDEYYIVGDFNGGAEAAVGNLEWQLEKATGSESKWGNLSATFYFQRWKDTGRRFLLYRPRKVRNVR